MSPTITRRQRALLLFLSASGYIAWFSGLGERTDAQGLGTTAVTTFTPVLRRRTPYVASLIVRDPFAGPRDLTERPANSDVAGGAVARSDVAGGGSAQAASAPALPHAGATGSSASGTGERSGASDDAGSVPNVAGGPGDAAVPGQPLVVRATIVGPNPVAYVANGSMMDIVRVGDTLAERRIAKIDLHGLLFADGSRLDLPDTFAATPRPQAASGHVTLDIRDLRRLLAPAVRAAAASPASSASAFPSTAPEVSAAAQYPSPGPLPTVDAHGLPVGVNPTSNPNNATPYPYPYPYAPPVR